MNSRTLHESNPIGQDRLDLLRTTAGAGPVLILTHDNPDPDALAAGVALSTLLKSAWDVSSRLIYSGVVARAENRAMLARLTPEWKLSVQLPHLEQYSAVALVDTQPGAGNNRLPEDYAPHIVFDHHKPIREHMASVRYADVRPEIGATVTLLYQHLEAAGIEPDVTLATAKFYGLKTDTRGLWRGASPADEAVYVKLLRRIDRKKLSHIEQAGLSQDYFAAFNRGLEAAHLHGPSVFANLGHLSQPDLTAEIADLLIRLESAQTALCVGRHSDTLYMSLRTKRAAPEAEALIQHVVVGLGTAGGHGRMAGGQVSLADRESTQLTDEIMRRFLSVTDAPSAGTPLLAE